jgi:zinc D-Ala-D-Ala carboxypeptidase
MLARILALFRPRPVKAPQAPAVTQAAPRDPAGEGVAKSPAVPVHAVGDAIEYASWELVPPSAWRWPHFRPRELACRGTGKLLIQRRALDALQALRRDIGKPLVISSGYRSPEHNAKVGGAKNSRHMRGDAFDVVLAGHDPLALVMAAKRAGFTGFGFYPASKTPFLHIDMGPPRAWGAPIPGA